MKRLRAAPRTDGRTLRALERARQKKSDRAITAILSRKRRPVRRPKPTSDPQVRLSIVLEGQAADIIAALAGIEGSSVSRTAVARTIVEDELWRRYGQSEQLRRHVAARIAGRAEAKRHRPEIDDLYDPLT